MHAGMRGLRCGSDTRYLRRGFETLVPLIGVYYRILTDIFECQARIAMQPPLQCAKASKVNAAAFIQISAPVAAHQHCLSSNADQTLMFRPHDREHSSCASASSPALGRMVHRTPRLRAHRNLGLICVLLRFLLSCGVPGRRAQQQQRRRRCCPHCRPCGMPHEAARSDNPSGRSGPHRLATVSPCSDCSNAVEAESRRRHRLRKFGPRRLRLAA